MEAEKLTKREQIAKDVLCSLVQGNSSMNEFDLAAMAVKACLAADALQAVLSNKSRDFLNKEKDATI